MVAPEPRRIGARADLGPAIARDITARPWSGRIRRAKLRRPLPPEDAVARPRLMAQIDEGQRPLTLVVAPAGFGKTTAAAEWANQEPYAAWLTADPADASLPHFWAHLCEALSGAVSDVGELVNAALDVPHRAPAIDLGRMLADELLDAPGPVRLVIDDFHLVPAGETHEFLAGLLEIAPPRLRLVITARSEPPLPLTRMRLRGTMTDLRGSDLLFTEEETQALLTRTGRGASGGDAGDATALWQRTRGWPAGLHLAAMAAERAAAAGVSPAAEAADGRLLAALLDETLEGRLQPERSALVRAAVPDRFDVHLVASLLDGDDAFSFAREAVRFALAADLCRPSARFGGDWLEFHPLFREGLLRRLEAEETPERLTALHTRAATWFEGAGLCDAAIGHWLAVGELETAIALVEREIQPAFDREDWPAVARWLALLPDEVVQERLSLLLAKGWLMHLRGQGTGLREVLRALEERLARAGLSDAELAAARAEMDAMALGTTLPIQVNPEQAVATASRAAGMLPSNRRFQLGMAWSLLGMALQAAGRGEEAMARIASLTELRTDQIDAGSIRGLFGLLFVHAQAANLSRGESLARTVHDVASRHRLRLATGWSHRFLGDVLYERNDLDGAIEQYGAVARDYEYFHLTGLREALFGLALAYVAVGRTTESWQALRRAREILAAAGALEHLPVLEAHEAYLALRASDLPRALAWARESDLGADSASFYVMVHPVLIRAAILCAAGGRANLDEALALLVEMRQRAERAHFLNQLVRTEALAAVAHQKRGERGEALAAMRRSLAIGAPQGFVRTYLDLLPTFTPEIAELAQDLELPSTIRAVLTTLPPSQTVQGVPALGPLEPLTDRERDVLAALCQRLSYKEIADHLFISPLTVKRHASSIYSKLGVSGRSEVVKKATELGWRT